MRKAKIILLSLLCLLWVPYFMGAWDKDKPAASTSLRSSNPEILANFSALETAIGNEHTFAAGTPDGAHTQGSARCFWQATAPTTQIDGGSFVSADLGSLWVDSDDNAIYILTATTPTWTPVSTEIIAILLASARTFGSTLDVTGALTALSTLDVIGNIDPTSYETTNGGFLDEDDMASDSATAVFSQQSGKAYIDALGDSGKGFVKCWAQIGANGTLQGTGLNITSSRSATGKYTVTWGTDFANDDYAVTVTIDGQDGGQATIATRAVGSVTVWTYNKAGTLTDQTFNIIAIGDQ